jgi:hypothetical protein
MSGVRGESGRQDLGCVSGAKNIKRIEKWDGTNNEGVHYGTSLECASGYAGLHVEFR